MSGTTGTIPLQQVVEDQLLTPTLWNGEFDNISALLDAEGAGGHSDTDAETQIQTNPFPGSVLSKATSVAGELERLRYQLAQILGTDYWYKPATNNLGSGGIVPIGSVVDYPSATPANSNWHLADGTAISRSVYATLFALVGTTFGVGDGGTTFNLPDYRDRMSIGAGTSYVAGATGGEATHILTTAELPHQTHTVTDPGHTHAITDPTHTHSINDPGHTHIEKSNIAGSGSSGNHVANNINNTGANVVNSSDSTASATTGITGNSASTGITGANSNTTGISVADTNGGGAHNNLPPYLGMYKMMRVL